MGIEEWGRRKACGIATLNAQRLVENKFACAFLPCFQAPGVPAAEHLV
ncbi:MAG: hypothetical protein ACYTX0_29235 [Nostoc sp.]